MSKFDRCIFISIAIGIWALAMTHIFKPNIADAGLTSMTPIKTIVSGRCPEWIKNQILETGSQSGTPTEVCFYQLTASADDLIVENSGDAGISVISPDANSARIQFGSVSDNDIGHIGGFYNSGNEYLIYNVDGSNKMIKKKEDNIISESYYPDSNYYLDQDNTSKETLICLLYTSPSPRDRTRSRMPSSA